MIISKRPKRITLPAEIDAHLANDGALHGALLTTIAEFEPLIEDNKLPFFPGYTDHGPDHIRSVITTATALITSKSWELVTEADLSLVVLGSLLHDCAMHLSEDGFRFLLEEEPIPIPFFDDPPWRVAWQTFLSEAMRWDGRKLHAVFGDTTPVRQPPLDALKMRMYDRLLIGEFVRLHHPRMAHEIAQRGFPGVGGRVPLIDSIDEEMRGLAALVARSHGMSIRAAVDRLPREQRRQVRGAHVPYAMALLRIADYIQIDEQRAPADLPRIRRLRSPLSRGEWNAHAAVKDLTLTHDDPEALLIRAVPESAATFLKLRGLFDSIQSELDESWAVLGEVYGRIPELNQLALRIRRLRSNIDDVKDLANTSAFVPVAARFDTAGADLLKLLIEPLYGAHPHIGVRELLQNAVDAVLERRDLFEDKVDDGPAVTIDLNYGGEGQATLDIVDQGVGMSVDTILNYFLKAGASFRNSEQWKSVHTDEGGNSRILRSGRFGIGALAAFLIGDRLEVSTRHVDDDIGVEFNASIDDEVIELRKVKRQPGTAVRVYVRKDAVNRLAKSDWDWFCLREPEVQRRQNGSELDQGQVFPSLGDELPPDWSRITPAGYQEVHWTFNRKSHNHSLVCNGIQVHGPGYPTEFLSPLLHNGHGERLSILMPTVSIFDPDGNLPLNLQRTALRTTSLPFSSDLIESIATDLVAFLYARAPVNPRAAFGSSERFQYPGVLARWFGNQEIWNWLWCTPTGWTLVDEDVLAGIAPKQMIVLFDRTAFGLDTIDFQHQSVMPMDPATTGSRDSNSWVRFVMGRRTSTVGPLRSLKFRGSVVMFSEKWFAHLSSELAQGTFRHSEIVHENGWTIVHNRDTSGATLDVKRIAAEKPREHRSAIAEILIERVEVTNAKHPLTQTWCRLVPGLTIPFDLVSRARIRPPEIEARVTAHNLLARHVKPAQSF